MAEGSRRIRGQERARMAKQLAKEYERGQSIRQLSGQHDLSIGTIRRLLLEQGVTFRARGGANRWRKA